MYPGYEIIESWDLEYCSMCVRLKAKKPTFNGTGDVHGELREGAEHVDMSGSRRRSQTGNALRALFAR